MRTPCLTELALAPLPQPPSISASIVTIVSATAPDAVVSEGATSDINAPVGATSIEAISVATTADVDVSVGSTAVATILPRLPASESMPL